MSLIPFAPFFTADFLAAFFALLLPPRPRRLVIGHVLLRGHARDGAADHVERQVLQLFEADATLESPAVCSAIRYGPISSFVLGFGVCVRLLLSAFH